MRLFRKLTAAAAAAALLFGMAALVPAQAASVCSIDTTTEYQTIRGFGGINLPEWISQGDLTDAQRQKAFGNGEDELGLTILRIYCSDDTSAWSRAVPTALYAQKMGATIFATPWNPPASIRENGTGGSRGGKYHLPQSSYAAYAQHLNNFYHYMEDNGVSLYSISVQNEPDYSEEWTAWSSDETTYFLANYADQIDCRVMSPETFQYTNKDYYTKILNDPAAYANCDLFGTHFYGTQRSQMDFPALESSGKEIWMTEVYVPNSEADSADRWPEALDVSANIHNGLVVGNLNAYVWWYIRRSYGLLKEDGTISKRGYCMAQYSKFVRPGDIRIDADESPADDVSISAYKNDEGQITIVAVNKGTDGYSQEFSLDSGETIRQIDRYRTTASENLAKTEALEFTGSSFWAQLPAQSVSTFVITTEGGGTYEPPVDEDGYYFHDTFEGDTFSWTGRGAASVQTSGRTAFAGSESLLVQDRTAAWNGAAKALNTKVFRPGTAYSFSADVMYLDGDDATEFWLKLQYTGTDGEPHYSTIAGASAVKGEWVQLANTSYTIPEGASDLQLYVETTDTTDNFYIDEAIGAPEGTVIPGAVGKVITGDVSGDGIINVIDLTLAKQGLVSGFGSASAEQAADLDGSGTVTTADLVLLQKWLLGLIRQFPQTNA